MVTDLRQTFKVHSVSQSDFDKWVKEAKGKKTLSQDTFDKQILPSTPNKELTFNGTHMAFVDPALILNISFTHINDITSFRKILTSHQKKIFIKMLRTNQLNLLVRLKLQTQTMNVMV